MVRWFAIWRKKCPLEISQLFFSSWRRWVDVPVCCPIAFAFLGKRWMFYRRLKQKCKQRRLEIPPHSFTGCVFATEAGRIHKDWRGWDVQSRPDSVSVTTMAIVCAAGIGSGEFWAGSGWGGFWEGFSEQILRTQRVGELCISYMKSDFFPEILLTALEKRNPLYSPGICCFSGRQSNTHPAASWSFSSSCQTWFWTRFAHSDPKIDQLKQR